MYHCIICGKETLEEKGLCKECENQKVNTEPAGVPPAAGDALCVNCGLDHRTRQSQRNAGQPDRVTISKKLLYLLLAVIVLDICIGLFGTAILARKSMVEFNGVNSSQPQILLNMVANDEKMNVPVRINAHTDVPFGICTDMSAGQGNGYFGVSMDKNALGSNMTGDPDYSAYLGWHDSINGVVYLDRKLTGHDNYRAILNIGGIGDARPGNQVRISDQYTLPVRDGKNGQVLVTNGKGLLSWRNIEEITGGKQIPAADPDAQYMVDCDRIILDHKKVLELSRSIYNLSLNGRDCSKERQERKSLLDEIKTLKQRDTDSGINQANEREHSLQVPDAP